VRFPLRMWPLGGWPAHAATRENLILVGKHVSTIVVA
jgi:hypothetical protein